MITLTNELTIRDFLINATNDFFKAELFTWRSLVGYSHKSIDECAQLAAARTAESAPRRLVWTYLAAHEADADKLLASCKYATLDELARELYRVGYLDAFKRLKKSIVEFYALSYLRANQVDEITDEELNDILTAVHSAQPFTWRGIELSFYNTRVSVRMCEPRA